MDMQDSGQRQQFATGAQRDTAEDKPRPDLISPFAEQRLGEWLAKGAKKYAERNWEQGIPFSRCTASLNRHLMQWKQGDESEDHLAAIMFNAMALIHYQEMIDRGVLDADLGDMPDYDTPDDLKDEDEDPWEKEPSGTCGVDVGETHRSHCEVMRALEKGQDFEDAAVYAIDAATFGPLQVGQQGEYEHASEDGWSFDFGPGINPNDVPIDPSKPLGKWRNYTITVDPAATTSVDPNTLENNSRSLAEGLKAVFDQVQFHRQLRQIEQEMYQAAGLPAGLADLLGCSTATEARLRQEQLAEHMGPFVPSKAMLHDLLYMAGKVHVDLDPPAGPFYTSPSGETSTCLEDVEVVTRPLSNAFHRVVCKTLADQGCPEELREVIAGGVRFPAEQYDNRFPRRFVYIAGPMRGYEQFNFPAFDRARNEWAKAGYATISPADIDRATGFDGSDDRPYYPDTDNDRVRADVVRDIHSIYSLDPSKGDKLALIQGWHRSTGALAEYALARWLGIPTVSAEDGETVSIEL